VSILKSIIKSIQNNKDTKKSPRSQYILGVLAMSAIADKVMANEQAIKTEGVIIDVVKLLKEQGIAVTPENINDIVLALAEGQEGQLIDLGYGLYQFIPADAQADIALQISSILLDTPITTEISLIDFTPVTDSTILFAEADDEGESSGFEFSIPMLGLLAVAAMGSNSNSAQAVLPDTDPHAEVIVEAEFDYADTKDNLAAQSVDSLTFSSFDTATFDMYDGAGGHVGGAGVVTGTFIIDSLTGLGIGTFASTEPFFGNLWTAHDVVIQISDDKTTAKLEMLFDWSVSLDIPVTLDVNITMDGDQITSFTAVDGDGDNILGNAMLSGPFTGFSPDFSGVTVTATSAEDSATQHEALSYIDNAEIAGDTSGTTDEDGAAITGQLTVTDIDNAEGSTSSIELGNDASDGTATIDAQGNWSYAPDADFNGDDSFTVDITDDLGNVSVQTIDLTVNSINDIPVATDDSVESGTPEYTLSTYDLTAVFQMREPTGNEFLDGGGNATTDSTVTGSLVIDHATGNGTITMASTQSFFGQAWTADDITIVKQVDGTYLADMMFHWGANDIHVTLDLEASFNLVDGTATLTALDGPGADGVIGNPMDNGPFAGQNAGFDFALTNQTDVTYDAVPGAAEDTAYVINVLDNDTDIDDDALTVTTATAPNGSVVINTDGTLTYTGDTNYNGTDIITYTISDGNGGESTATVTVGISAVNDDPIATDDTAITVDEDTASDAINVLGNDSDAADGDTLSVAAATATNGSVVINADGTLTYTGNADFNGADTITYTVSDGNGGTDTATVGVTVNPTADAPVIDTAAIIAAMGDIEFGGDPVTIDVLANTTDADAGSSLSITDVSTINYLSFQAGQENGSVVDNGDGTVTFTPGSSGGSQNITVTVSDGALSTSETFTVTVVDNIDEAAIAQAAADAAALAEADAAAQALGYADAAALEAADVAAQALGYTDAADQAAAEQAAADALAANNAPTITSNMSDHTDMLSIDVGSEYSQPTATHFTDADTGIGDTLTYSATLADGSELPSWLGFDTTTGILNGTPLDTNVGAIDITVTATDSFNASVSDTYTLTVNAVVVTETPVVMDDQLIQIRAGEVITKEQASIDEYGADYTGGDTGTLIKYEMWIDADARCSKHAEC